MIMRKETNIKVKLIKIYIYFVYINEILFWVLWT